MSLSARQRALIMLLSSLRQRGWTFAAVPADDDGGAPDAIFGAYFHRSATDLLHVWSEDEAHGARIRGTNRHEPLWTYSGGLFDVIDQLVDLPHPDAPQAPRLARPSSALWLPGDPPPRPGT